MLNINTTTRGLYLFNKLLSTPDAYSNIGVKMNLSIRTYFDNYTHNLTLYMES